MTQHFATFPGTLFSLHQRSQEMTAGRDSIRSVSALLHPQTPNLFSISPPHVAVFCREECGRGNTSTSPSRASVNSFRAVLQFRGLCRSRRYIFYTIIVNPGSLGPFNVHDRPVDDQVHGKSPAFSPFRPLYPVIPANASRRRSTYFVAPSPRLLRLSTGLYLYV